LKRLAVIAAFALGLGACADINSKPLLNIENAQAPAKSAAQIHDAARQGLEFRGWTVLDDKPNEIVAELAAREKHSAKIRIPIADGGYSIEYVESTGLDYDPATKGIHHNYNRWVANLKLEIDTRLGLVAPPVPKPQPAPRPKTNPRAKH
jgi:hypothetical protein